MPLLTLGSPGRFFGRGDARRGDVTRFPLGFRLLAMSGLVCYLTRSLEIYL